MLAFTSPPVSSKVSAGSSEMMSSMFIAITSVEAGVSACATGIITAAASASALTTAFMAPSHGLCATERRTGNAPRQLPAIAKSGLAVGAGHPEHVGGAAVVQVAGQHEQVIGEPVEIVDRVAVDRLPARQLRRQALRPAHDRARQMEM